MPSFLQETIISNQCVLVVNAVYWESSRPLFGMLTSLFKIFYSHAACKQ